MRETENEALPPGEAEVSEAERAEAEPRQVAVAGVEHDPGQESHQEGPNDRQGLNQVGMRHGADGLVQDHSREGQQPNPNQMAAGRFEPRGLQRQGQGDQPVLELSA